MFQGTVTFVRNGCKSKGIFSICMQFVHAHYVHFIMVFKTQVISHIQPWNKLQAVPHLQLHNDLCCKCDGCLHRSGVTEGQI